MLWERMLWERMLWEHINYVKGALHLLCMLMGRRAHRVC